MRELERYNKLKEELTQEYNKELNGEALNTSKLMYEYLGDPKDHIDYFNKEDYVFPFLPTIIWMPWRYRYHSIYVVDFYWLIFRIGFGVWERRRDDI